MPSVMSLQVGMQEEDKIDETKAESLWGFESLG